MATNLVLCREKGCLAFTVERNGRFEKLWQQSTLKDLEKLKETFGTIVWSRCNKHDYRWDKSTPYSDEVKPFGRDRYGQR